MYIQNLAFGPLYHLAPGAAPPVPGSRSSFGSLQHQTAFSPLLTCLGVRVLPILFRPGFVGCVGAQQLIDFLLLLSGVFIQLPLALRNFGLLRRGQRVGVGGRAGLGCGRPPGTSPGTEILK